MFKKSMIVVLILLCCMAISGVCLSEDSNVLKITAKELSYANLYRQIDIPLNAKTVTLEYYIKVASTGMEGLSFGPGVHFWWDTANQGVAIKVNSAYGDGRLGSIRFFDPTNRGMDKAGYKPSDTLPVPIYSKVWYGYKVQLDSEKVRFYIREIEGDWVELELATVDRDLTISNPPDGLIIGIGGPQEFGPDPRFRNSINDQTRLEKSKARSMLFDNIVVTVDGKVVFTETFERNIDELETDWNLAADPTNEGTVFEVISEPGNRPLPTIIEFSM